MRSNQAKLSRLSSRRSFAKSYWPNSLHGGHEILLKFSCPRPISNLTKRQRALGNVLRLIFKVYIAVVGIACGEMRALMLMLASVLACFATTAYAATPAGADIINTARFEVVVDGITLAVDGVKGIRTSSNTPSRVTLAQILPASQTGAPVAVLLPTSCRNSAGVWNILPAPSQSGTVVPTNTNVRTVASQALHGGEPLLVTLTDYDQNRDLNLAEVDRKSVV